MRTIIAGSRGITSYALVEAAISSAWWTPTVVLCGLARGVDLLGERWAMEHGIPVEKFPARWQTHGKQAGFIRNLEMANRADALIALWDGRSPGTKHMIGTALVNCIPVMLRIVKSQ